MPPLLADGIHRDCKQICAIILTVPHTERGMFFADMASHTSHDLSCIWSTGFVISGNRLLC